MSGRRAPGGPALPITVRLPPRMRAALGATDAEVRAAILHLLGRALSVPHRGVLARVATARTSADDMPPVFAGRRSDFLTGYEGQPGDLARAHQERQAEKAATIPVDIETRMALAEDPSTPPAVVDALLTDGDAFVRAAARSARKRGGGA